MNRVTAVFDSRTDAERAIQRLRNMGIDHDRISIVARRDMHDGAASEGLGRTRGEGVDEDPASDLARGAGTGAAVGAGVGALFGLAAVVIPGVGPFITAGALASALGITGGAAVAGATVGATAGALSGALAKWGLDQADADHIAGEVERGGILVAVDVDNPSDRARVDAVLREANGRLSGTAAR